MLNKFLKLVLPQILPLAVVATLLAGLSYLVVQQNYRQSANDPQIQVAEDFAAELSNGAPLSQIDPSFRVDISKSLSTYVIVYDQTGKPVTGSGVLNGALPTLPAGVTDYVGTHGEDRITWQPQPGVRSALVVTPYHSDQSSGYVAVGRSLRETEIREGQLGFDILLGWLFTMIAIVLTSMCIEILK